MQADQDRRGAVVTGGAMGIGRAFAERLARDGLRVAVLDIADASETVAAIESQGGTAAFFQGDLSDPESAPQLASKVLSEFGQVDVLVNTVGFYPAEAYDAFDYARWRQIFAVNIDTVFLMCQAFAPGMIERGWGRIINMSSSTFPYPNALITHYTATKGAVEGYTRALAAEISRHGVNVNAIGPGLTLTEGLKATGFDAAAERFIGYQAIKRVGVAADMAGALSFLASDDAEFITGRCIPVDGGLVAF